MANVGVLEPQPSCQHRARPERGRRGRLVGKHRLGKRVEEEEEEEEEEARSEIAAMRHKKKRRRWKRLLHTLPRFPFSTW